MSECVVRMEMPHVCITDNGYYGYCPMDRVWCIQRNAPPDITMREAYEAMTEKIPSWCPIICQLPEGHGDLISRYAIAIACPGQIRMEDGKYWIRLSAVQESIKSAPTIVPAEAERNKE